MRKVIGSVPTRSRMHTALLKRAVLAPAGFLVMLSRLVKRSLIQLVLFVLASSLAQAGPFTITFIDTSANHLDATGSFNYDTQSGFSAFIVQWNGVTFDMTGPANNPSIVGIGIACLLTASPQLSFGVLNHSVPDCPLFANPIWQGTSNSTTIEFRIASLCADGDCGSVFFSGSLINQSNNPATSSQGTFDSPYCTDGDCGSLCADGDCGSVFLSGSLINQSNNPAHRFPGNLRFPNRRYDTRAGATWSAVGQGFTGIGSRDVVFDSWDSRRIYAGVTVGDNLFKSTDGGLTWSRRRLGSAAVYVIAVAVDPVSPNVVYAGTQNEGLFKSID